MNNLIIRMKNQKMFRMKCQSDEILGEMNLQIVDDIHWNPTPLQSGMIEVDIYIKKLRNWNRLFLPGTRNRIFLKRITFVVDSIRLVSNFFHGRCGNYLATVTGTYGSKQGGQTNTQYNGHDNFAGFAVYKFI